MTTMDFTSLLAQIEQQGGTLRTDSRRVETGDIFFSMPPAVPGSADHSRHYELAALQHGAAFIVAAQGPEAGFAAFPAAWIQVDDIRQALGQAARARYQTGTLPFPLIAVTGTNGKTTTAYLGEYFLRSIDKPAGIMGTVSYRWPGHEEEAPLTTPDCLTLHQSLAAMRESTPGVYAAIMEVSSHALDQNRIAGLSFAAALFTNLTQDHLDYHKDMEEYFQAKRRLFHTVPEQSKYMIINADDPYGRRLLEEFPHAQGYSLELGADNVFLSCRVLSNSPQGLHLRLETKGLCWEMHSPLVGRHNAANLAGVMALGLSVGFVPDDFFCFQNFYGVPGRLERIPFPSQNPWEEKGRESGVFVDYAHTPDALIRAQEALRDAGFKRLITIFGCGGDRDRTKRPIMGEAVARNSDIAVVTSDNPRTEDPATIINDIMPGLALAGEVHRREDRREALALALELLQPGDALLVAGKGHEPYQIIGTTKYPFSDQAILRELMQCN